MDQSTPGKGSDLFGVGRDHSEIFQSLDDRFVKNKTSTFFFEAQGDGMNPLIKEGDILVVDRSLPALWGRVVIVSWQEELLCKRLVREGKRIFLRSENFRYQDILITGEGGLNFWGVVRAIVHPLLEREGR